jgi:hypothetical protein
MNTIEYQVGPPLRDGMMGGEDGHRLQWHWQSKCVARCTQTICGTLHVLMFCATCVVWLHHTLFYRSFIRV